MYVQLIDDVVQILTYFVSSSRVYSFVDPIRRVELSSTTMQNTTLVSIICILTLVCIRANTYYSGTIRARSKHYIYILNELVVCILPLSSLLCILRVLQLW